MHIEYNREKLEQIIKDLTVLTDISISFLDAEGTQICRSVSRKTEFCEQIQKDTEKQKACLCSDQIIIARCKKSLQFESHICHAGLFDAAMPIIKNNIVAGFILLGRIRSANSPISPTCPDGDLKLYNQMSCLTDAQLKSFQALLPDILFENAIYFVSDALSEEAADYIKSNLHTDLSIKKLCEQLHTSKNNLYRSFHKQFGCTINQYISDMRIERAKQLLSQTDSTVYLICEQVGIPNSTYFCKLFKRKTGLTPTEYKKHA